MRRDPPPRRRRSEADRFRLALLHLRGKLTWNQDTLAARLSVSKRTLSSWECGYWLPPFKQRPHIVLALHDVPPEYVLEIADSLGVSLNPAVAPLLQPYRDALDGTSSQGASEAPPAPPAPPPEPPRPAPTPEQLRAAVDAVVRDAADAMNVAANDLRAAIGRTLATSAELGATLDDLRIAVTVRGAKAKAKAKAK